MKKYLLVALLAMGATSFGAVVGTSTDVNMPIRATGEIVERTNSLVIESTTAGMAGNVMQFEFGALPKADTDTTYKTKELTGTFKITRADGTAIKAKGSETVKVGLNTTADATTAQSSLDGGKIKINYTLSLAPLADSATAQEGTVVAQAEIGEATIGNFADTTQRIYVNVQ